MKILYHHRTLGDGAEGIHIREMVKAFRDLGHIVKVIGPTGEVSPGTSPKSKNLGKLKRSIPPALYELFEIAYTCYSFFNLIREIRSFKPDFIYDRYITFNAGPVLAGIVHHIPVFLEVNAPLAVERSAEQDERLVLRKIAFLIEKWVCSHASRTIVVSTPLKEYLESIGVPKIKCVVMPNGVDPSRFYPRNKNLSLLSALGISGERFYRRFLRDFASMARTRCSGRAISNMAKKGYRVALLIVGDGPFGKSLKRWRLR